MVNVTRPFLLLLFLLLTPVVHAESASLLVALHIQSTRLDLTYPSGVRNTEISSLSLLWAEPLTSSLDGYVKLSTVDWTQTSNPVAEGQSTSGNALALGLQVYLFRSDALRVHADLGYEYTDTSTDQAAQKVAIRWHQMSGQLTTNIRLFRYTDLMLAVGGLTIDGKETATGTVNSTMTFDATKRTFTQAGLLIGVDQYSHIGIEMNAGAMSGGRIYFQRWF